MSTIRRSFLLPFLILAALLAPHTLPAQPTWQPRLCTPDCPESPWQNVYNTITVGITCGTSSCTFRCYYARRTACPPAQYIDVQLHRIELLTPGCYACSTHDLLAAAITFLLTNPLSPLPRPEEGKCIPNFRVSIGACWRKFDMVMPLGDVVTCLAPCDPAPCCFTRYLVCKEGDKFVAYPQGGPPVDPPCGPDAESGGECFPVCSETWLDVLGKLTSGSLDVRPAAEMITYAGGGTANIVCQAVDHGWASLEIVDLVGHVLRTEQVEPDPGLTCRFSVDLSGLPAGTYLCRIVNGGRNVMSSPIYVAP